jgi:hypothetical protein
VYDSEAVDFQLSAEWDLPLQAVRGTDNAVEFTLATSAVLGAVDVCFRTISHSGNRRSSGFCAALCLICAPSKGQSYHFSADHNLLASIFLSAHLRSS